MGQLGESVIFEIDTFGDLIGKGITDSHYCSMGGVVKLNNPKSELAVANEFIASRLASLMGLPVPPGAVARTDRGDFAYVALRFGRKGEKPPPLIPAELIQHRPRLAARIVTFDCWIANADRNADNVAFSRDPLIEPVIFDHERALAGIVRSKMIDYLQGVQGQPAFGGCLFQMPLDGVAVLECAREIKGLPPSQLRYILEDVVEMGLLNQPEVKTVESFLLHRRDQLETYVRHLPNVENWGMFG